jgi:iron complex outermembrane recepter protein
LHNAYFNVSTPIPVNKWWNGYANVTVFYNHYIGELPNGTLNERAFGLNYYIQQNFTLGKGWSTQVSSWFNSGTKEAIFRTAAFGSLDASVRKKILKQKASIILTINDVL